MPKYQATDSQTGETFEFEWYSDTPPTDADLEEVFAQARQLPAEQPQEEPSMLGRIGQAAGKGVLQGIAGPLGPQIARAAIANPAGVGAIIGGMAAAPATGGLSLPLTMATIGGASAGGAALGQMAEEAARGSAEEPEAMGRVGRAALKEGALGAGGAMFGPPLRKVGEMLYRGAVPMIRGALKPTLQSLKHRAQIEGDLTKNVADDIAAFIADQRLRTPEQAQGLVSQLGRQIDEVVGRAEAADPNLVLDTAERIPAYLEDLMTTRVEPQILPRADRQAIQNVGRELVEDSPLSTSTQVPYINTATLEQDLARGARAGTTMAENLPLPPTVVNPRGVEVPVRYRGPETQFAGQGARYSASSRPRALREDVRPSEGIAAVRTKSYFDPEQSASRVAGARTIERAVRDSIKEAVPETRPLLEAQGRAIDAVEALNREALNGVRPADFAGHMVASGLRHGPTVGILWRMAREGALAGGITMRALGERLAASGQPVGPNTLANIVRGLNSFVNSLQGGGEASRLELESPELMKSHVSGLYDEYVASRQPR